MAQDFEFIRQHLTKDAIPFILRPAAPSDTDSIRSNIQLVCDEQIYLHTDTFMLTPEWRKAFERSVDNIAGYLLLVVQAEGQIVGHLRLFAEWYGNRGRHVGDIGIVLLPEWRGHHIGTTMLHYAVDWAKQVRFEKLTATVIATNERALNLFRNFEFVQEGYRSQQLKIGQEYYDEILLGRFL